MPNTASDPSGNVPEGNEARVAQYADQPHTDNKLIEATEAPTGVDNLPTHDPNATQAQPVEHTVTRPETDDERMEREQQERIAADRENGANHDQDVVVDTRPEPDRSSAPNNDSWQTRPSLEDEVVPVTMGDAADAAGLTREQLRTQSESAVGGSQAVDQDANETY